MTVKQIRYNMANASQNNPSSDAALLSGEEAIKIGIQATPGTKFKINGKTIMIGNSGIYELENITVNEIKLASVTSDPIIIDYITKEGGL